MLLTAGDISWERRLCLDDRNALLMMLSLPRIWSGALIGRHCNIAISFKLSFTNDRQGQKVTKVKCKPDESTAKQSLFLEYILLQKKNLSFAITCLQRNRPGET